MYVERTENGEINLYGSHDEHSKKLVVCTTTKKHPDLAAKILGEGYSNEKLVEKLKDRPTHNFIGWLVNPISMPISMDDVIFV